VPLGRARQRLVARYVLAMSESKVAVVLGIGPGLGSSAARRFAAEGYAVGLMARRAAELDPVSAAIAQAGGRSLSVTADATQPDSVAAAFARVREELGAPEVLVYNAGAFEMAGILELSPDRFVDAWKASCLGAFLAAREVLPAMVERGRGTILLTGATASLRGSARFSGLAVGKFGLRALSQSMAREFGPRGVHVAHIIIDGQIDTPRLRQMQPGREDSSLLSPDAIANEYWNLHSQHPTTWTLELDLRPAVEKF
jgi:NAD(P)-dependent dehydrogenase (short-subunit alcohol dehydrogenase family)